MSDYAVKVTIRNGRILRMMRAKGIETAAELSRLSGVSYPVVVKIIGMKLAPEAKDGRWIAGVEDIAGILGCDPEDMFTDTQRGLALKHNTRETYMDEPDVMALASGNMEQQVWAKMEAQKLLECLTPRERRVMEAFADGATLDEIGKDERVGKHRISQIQNKAIRKMKGAAARAEAAVKIEQLPETVAFKPNPDWKPRHVREAEERQKWRQQQEEQERTSAKLLERRYAYYDELWRTRPRITIEGKWQE